MNRFIPLSTAARVMTAPTVMHFVNRLRPLTDKQRLMVARFVASEVSKAK